MTTSKQAQGRSADWFSLGGVSAMPRFPGLLVGFLKLVPITPLRFEKSEPTPSTGIGPVSASRFDEDVAVQLRVTWSRKGPFATNCVAKMPYLLAGRQRLLRTKPCVKRGLGTGGTGDEHTRSRRITPCGRLLTGGSVACVC